jgi:HD superfamily phosphohydrolase
MRATKRIRTVLYGDQRLTIAELEVLHTPAMQRLYGLRQLGLTDRIFIDASHARIHHVVGVLHQVDNLVSAIVSNLLRSKGVLQFKSPTGETRTISAKSQAQYVQRRKSVIRFIGLLHDLTHAPFGHTIEDEIKLVDSQHDQPKRQSDAFYRLLCQLVAWLALEAYGPEWTGFPDSLKPFLSQGATALPPPASTVGGIVRELLGGLTEPKAGLCLKLSPWNIAEMFVELGYAMTALLHLQVLHEKEMSQEIMPEEAQYPFQEVVRIALESTQFASFAQKFRFEPHRDAFMLDIVGNTVCADLLDYAGRDSHYAGLRLDYDPSRIAENFTLVSFETKSNDHTNSSGHGAPGTNGRPSKELRNPFEGWCLRTAISLFSHKYRTDVPSELMNLLNVRFYLYERVIFHSTKCAAGSMLGTALQLMGWRELSIGNRPGLPKHLEFVGDDVFLHDICAALSFLIDTVSCLPKEDQIDTRLIQQVAGLERVHNGLIKELLEIREGKSAGAVLEELRAAKLLLDRLMSRRYFRPVFRASPGTKQPQLRLDADDLAKIFTLPDIRYKTERNIEDIAELPKGTITIHCPRRNTAEKIANVLLTKPAEDGGTDPVHKLNCISELDSKTFGKHEDAVKAVEAMYKSMWRLTVYAAAEHMDKWTKISKAAGHAIFAAADEAHGSRCKRDWPNGCWDNDSNFEQELAGKTIGASGRFGGGTSLIPLGEILGQVGDGLLESGRIVSVPSEFYDAEEGLTEEGRRRIEEALVVTLSITKEEAVEKVPRISAAPRMVQVMTTVQTYIMSMKGKDKDSFRQKYSNLIDGLPTEAFEKFKFQLDAAVAESKRLEMSGAANKGTKYKQICELIDQLLEGLVLRVADSNGGLFGDHGA